MANSLTQRQQQVLDFIRDSVERMGTGPSVREIASELGASNHNGMRKHLEALVKKGFISIREGAHRGIQLLEESVSMIPIYGKVAAGMPIEASEHVVNTIPMPLGLFRKNPDYFLKVEGDSMEDALIFEGDLVAVQRAETADSGQIIVASINTDEMSREEMDRCGINRNGLTIKKLGFSENEILLKSMNRAKGYEPFRINPQSLSIAGIFLGTIRAV